MPGPQCAFRLVSAGKLLFHLELDESDFDYAWLDGVTFRAAKIRKAVFPLKKLSLDSIRESVRTGKRVAMEPFALDDDEA